MAITTTIKLFQSNENVRTLQDFASYHHLRIREEGGEGYMSLDEFFENNRESIFSQLGTERLQALAAERGKRIEDLTSSDIDRNVTLPCPCYLIISSELMNYSTVARETNFQEPETDVLAFENEAIRNIVESSMYKFKNRAIRRSKPGCRVIGFFKSLYYSGKRNNDSGRSMDNIYDMTQNFVDLSPFVISLNTSSSDVGGSFTLTLPHVPVYSDKLTSDTMANLLRDGVNSSEFISASQISGLYVGRDGDELSVRAEVNAMDYFEWLVQPNDLLFLSFDDMSEVTNDCLAGNVFDMIALVDSVSVARSATGSVSVDVAGRDLIKLLTDDASIYFPQGVSDGNKSVYDNTETVLSGGDLDSVYRGADDQDGTPRQITGALDIFASEPGDFSIDYVLKVVISHLANMQIVPDDLFINWGDRRTRFSMLKPKRSEN